MNKIFKVVWNRTIGSFVVTSELAKGRVKSSSEGAEGDVRASEEGRLKTLFRLTALSAALLGLSEGAWAAMNTKPATGGAVFAIGDGSTSANGTGALAIGNNAQAKTNGALAIGPNSTHTTIANSNNSIAIGVNLQSTGQKAIGIGADTNVNGTSAIAIGNNDSGRITNQGVSGDGAIGVGSNLTVRGNNAIAVGTEAQAKEISAVAVGANTQATGVEAVAIGKGAQATKKSSIAIGKNTQATEESAIVIGSDDVQYGEIKSSSRQGIAIGVGAKATGATQSIALGPDAISSGTQSTSIGNNTRATGDSSIAIGGDDWNIVRTKQVAAAGNKLVHQVFEELTGMPMKQQGQAYGNPFKGTTAGDAAVAIGVTALAEGALSTAFGSAASASGVGAAAFGVGATASQNKSVAIGAGSHTRTDATAVTEATVNGVTYRGFAGTEHITTGSQVSFGSAGYERQLKHVAPGAITSTSTDAINGSQLYALHVGAGNIAKSVANALGGGAAVSNDPTNNQGSFVTLPTYNVLKGSATPNTVGNGTVNFNATPARSVADALTNLNTYVNQGFTVKDNSGAAKGIVTPGESVQFADGNATTVTVDTEANGNTKIKYDVQVDGETVKIKNGKLTAASQTHFYSVKNEDQTKGNYNNDGATGDNALAAGVDASATANGTTAVGLKAQASAESAIAVGSETKAAAKNAVVIGNKASVEAATGSVANVNGTTTGEGSVAVGAASKASGTNATAVGQAANAFGQNSFAGGQNSKASGKSSVAIGDGANATDDSSSAVGPYAQATKSGASAFGYYANAFGQNSLAAGRNAQATNDNAVALGNESKATGQNTIAFGNNANASQNQAMALGRNTVASAGYTVALGDEAKATAIKAIAFGSSAQATGTNSVATGVQAKAHADDALAVGSNANASGESAIALGKQSNAWKVNSLAFGNSANSNGERAIAIGLESVSNGQNAVSVGQKAYADEHGVAIGSESNAAQAAAIAIGNKAQAMKYSSIVIGEEAKSNNSRSVVIGYHASATNPAMSASNQDTNQTVAIGAYANAWGDQSTAIGNNVDAKGNSSIAIGADDWDTVAVKTVAGTGKTVKQVYQDYTGDVMETGDDTYTHTTSGEAAVAIGTKSQAEGELSTAFGTGTRAQGVASAAFGMGAKATKGNSVAIGAGSTTTTDATSVNEAKVNDLKYSGFAGGNNVTSGDQVSFGSKNYERQLKNVAPGEISSTSTDAINGSQLYAVQNVLGNTAKTVKNVLGGNAAVGEDGSITMNNIGGTGENTVDRAIASLKTSAFKSFQLDTAVATGTNGRAENHSSQEITSGSTLRLEAGKNIHLHQSGTTVSINTVDNPEFTGVVTAKGGLNMSGNRITNLGQGTDTNDAVNVGQLQDAMNNLRVNTLTTVSNDAPFSYIDKDGKLLTRNVKEVGGQKVVSFTYVDGGAEYTGDVTIAALNAKDPQTSVPTIVGNVKSGIKDNDAVNVSQLKKIAEALGTQVGTDGSVSMPTYAVVSDSPATSSVVNYNTVGDALSALNRAVNSPLNFTGDVGNQFNRKLGSTVAVKGGQTDRNKLSDNNIGVVSDDQNHTLNVKLAKELTGLTSAAFSDGVTTGGTTVNGSGVTIGSGSNTVSLTAGGLSNGGNKVTNIADGAVDTDAASYKQVKAAKTEVQGGTNVASVTKTDSPTDGHTVYTVNAKGAAVALDSSVDGLKLTSSEDTTTNVTTYKLDLSGKTKASLTKADSALQNIGVQVNGEDAKTLNQADSKLNFVNGTGTTAENKGGAVAFNVNKSTLTAGTDGTVNAGKAGDAFATAADVAQAINEAVANSEKTSVVEKGDNTHVAAVEAGNKTTYTVHADNTTVSVKDGGKLKLESSEKANANQTKTTNYELDLTDAAKAEIQKGVDAKTAVDTKGITFNGDSGSPVTKKLDETLAIKGDDKNVETEAGTNGIKVKLKDDITLTSVTAETLKAGDSILTTTGLTTPKVTAGDSVLTTDGLTIANGANPVSLTKSGLNNGGNKIAKVAKGTDATDGVNVSQLSPIAKALNTSIDPATGDVAAPAFTVTKADGTKHEAVGTVQDALNKVGEEVSKGLKIAADNGNEDKVNLGETVTYTSKDKNIVTTVADNKIDFSLAEKVTIGKDAANGGKPVVIDGKEGIVSGLTNTTLGGTDFATSNKAATEAQLDATQVNLKNILGGEAKNENGNVSTANIGDTGKGNVHEAIKSVKETAEKGWKLKVNEETSSEKISPDDEVAIKEGKNIKVTRNGKNITVATAEDVEFNAVNATNVIAETVIAGNSVLTTDGLKIGADSSPNQVSLTTAGLNNGGNKIANVAKGTEDTDGVNVSQIKPLATALNTTVGADGSIAEPNFTVNHADGTAGTPVHTVQDALNEVGKELNKGLNIVADNGSSEKVNLGDTVTYTSKDKNIVTTSGTGKAIDFSLAEKVTIGKDAANGGKPVVIDGKEGIVSGLTNTTLGSAPLAGSNKAATEAQLDATQVNLATILGGNAANNNGNVTTNNIGGTGKDNVHEAIAAVKETADKGWNLKANDETDSEKIAAGDTVTVKQGKNIRVKRSGKDLTIETEDDVAFNKVTVGNSELTTTGLTTPKVTAGDSVLTTDGLNIANGTANAPVSLTKDGLNNGGNKVTSVAKGTADTDGVNVSQLNPVAKALNTNIDPTTGEVAAPTFTVTKADGTKHPAVGTVQDALDKVGEEVTKGLNIVADNGSSEKVNLGDTVKYTSKDKNIVTTSGTGKAIDFSLAEKVTIGKDAANGGKPVVIDGKEGIVSGLTNTTLGAAPLAGSNKAVTEAQLDATQVNLANVLGGNAANNNGNVTTSDIGGTGENNVHDAIKSVKATADKGWNLNANDETSSEKIGAGDTVTFKEGKNVKVSRNGKNITVATSDDVSFNKVTVGGSVLTDNGLTVGNGKAGKPVSLTKDGLDNGGNKVANVAKGEADTDAVNVAQLKAAAAKATSKVDSGNDNIVVTPEQNADGSTTYKVATAPNLKADSFTAGDTVVNNDGVKVGDKVALGKDGLKAGDVNITADGIDAGNKAISNVAKGTDDTDAVNVAQLNEQLAATEK
uniref:ESPR-type extended signal peptide-containing protein n=1 Tax=Neisseria sicca TaxID=490 RepID=UPI0028804D9D